MRYIRLPLYDELGHETPEKVAVPLADLLKIGARVIRSYEDKNLEGSFVPDITSHDHPDLGHPVFRCVKCKIEEIILREVKG